MSRKKGSFVDYADYTLGFSIIDGRDTGYESRLTPAGFFDRIDIAPVDPMTGKPSIEMLTSEQKAILDEAWNDESTNEATGQTLQIPFETKRDRALMVAQSLLDTVVIIDGKQAGDLILATVETIVSKMRISWYNRSEMTAGDENYIQAIEIKDDIVADILFPTIIGHFNSSKYKNLLAEVWGEATESRLAFIQKHYIPYIRKNKCVDVAINYATNDIVKHLKNVGHQVDKEERKNLWIYLAIVSKMHPKYSTYFSQLEWKKPTNIPEEQKAQMKFLLKQVAVITYWTTLSRMIEDNQSQGGEPGWEQLESRTEIYERDYSDLERMARDGSGEIWFNQCFSAFNWTSVHTEDGATEKSVERTNYYRKAVDSHESKASLELGVQLLNVLQTLCLKGIDVNTYKITKKGTKIKNMRFIDLIKYYNGKSLINISKVQVEGADEPATCKKYSYQRLMDYHAKVVTKVYWDIYNYQKSNS